jgi:hypothetical protein
MISYLLSGTNEQKMKIHRDSIRCVNDAASINCGFIELNKMKE